MAIELDGLYGVTSDGNITTGNYFIGNGYYLTNVQSVSSYNDANVTALLASGTVSIINANDLQSQSIQTLEITAFGDISTTGFFVGDGSQLTNLPTSNLSNLTTNIVTTANISGNNLSVTGNAVLGSIYSDNYFYANGVPFSASSSGVIIGDQQITGDGNTTYSLDQAATTQSVIVTLNGVTQTPTAAYTVAGNTITFASAVSNTNVVDIRYFAASGGNVDIYGDANVAVFLPTYTGSLTQAVGFPKSTVQNSSATTLTISQQVTTFSAPTTVTATLPPIDSSTIGVQYTIVDTWGGSRGINPINIIVNDIGNETIDGGITVQLTAAYGVIVVMCVSATEWIVISN